MIGSRPSDSSARGIRIPRRTFLRGALSGVAVGIGLPILEAMLNRGGTAHADGTALPRRLGIFFWGNGVHPDRWRPTTIGPDWMPGEQLVPLAPLKSRVTVVTGMNNPAPEGDGHGSGAAALLTGWGFKTISATPKNLAPTQESIDQVAAKKIGTTTAFKSLELRITRRVHKSEGLLYGYVSFSGPSAPNEPEGDPVNLYNRIFADFKPSPGTPPPVDATVALRKSVLDAVLADIQSLRGRVGASDRARLEQHFEGIRAIETRLEQMKPSGMAPPMSCIPPSMPAPFSDTGPQEQLAARMKVMSELLAMALACDRTRVFTIQFTGSVAVTVYPIPGFSTHQHQLSHEEPGNQPLMHQSILYTMKEFGTLVSALDAHSEATGGTLLDTCAVLATSDCAEGRSHIQTDYPILIAGGARGKLRMGIHHRSNGESTNKVLFSLLNAVGCNLTEFGEKSAIRDISVTSGLSAIEI